MSLLFFDTETTGLPRPSLPLTDPSQPHIVQVAAILADSDGRELSSFSTLIQPDGWTIDPAAEAVHGISLASCTQWGIPVQAAMAILNLMATRANRIVAHNLDFDSKLMGYEYARLSRPSCPFVTPSEGQDHYCTMKASTNVCRIPSKRGYKWPKLVEAHQLLLNEGFDGAHDALVDVRACMRVYFALQAHAARAD